MSDSLKKEESGICMFAYNNDQLDYVQFAHIAAGYIKAHMKNKNTCLITDDGTYNWLKDSIDSKWHSAFDSPWTEFTAPFYNNNKDQIFSYTPFEKTLLIDTDYIIQNNFYDYIFNTNNVNPMKMPKFNRRFLCLDVNASRMNDYEYFKLKTATMPYQHRDSLRIHQANSRLLI